MSEVIIVEPEPSVELEPPPPQGTAASSPGWRGLIRLGSTKGKKKNETELPSAGLRAMLRTIMFASKEEPPVPVHHADTELKLHCLTSEELQKLAQETFSTHYPHYTPAGTMKGRRENPLGFHTIDYTQANRAPEVPSRVIFETHKIHGGVRGAFRMAGGDEQRRFEFIAKQLTHNNVYGVPRGAAVGADEMTYAASLQGMSLSKPGRSVKLAGSIGMCRSLVYLNIGGSGVGGRLSDFVIPLTSHENLTRLNISGARLGVDGAAALGDVLAKNSSLRHVDASLNNVEDSGCEKICKGILRNRNSKLNSLNLSTNKIGAKGGHQLSMLMRDHGHLRELVLWRNNLGARPVVLEKSGFDYMADVIPSACMLYHLDVAHNNIRCESVDLLIAASEEGFIASSAGVAGVDADATVADSKEAQSDESGSSKSGVRPRRRNPPPRHLSIASGNQVFPDHLRKLSEYYEVTPYTTRSRANVAAYSF